MEGGDVPHQQSFQTVEEIRRDASARRYRRVRLEDGRFAVEVLYPAGVRSLMGRDLEVRAWLAQRGLRVPILLAEMAEEGRALLEDFGNRDAAAVLGSLEEEERTRRTLDLVEPLQVLSRLTPGELPAWNQPLDRDRLRWELAGFELWFLRYGLGVRPPEEVSLWLDELAERVAAHPARVCHRDFHLNNLFLLGSGEVGVIDYQDVLVGPDTYDLASLVGERELPELTGEAGRERLAGRWASSTGAAPGWERRLEETTMQRGLKVVGTFSRLVMCGRREYAQWLVPLLPRLAHLLPVCSAPPMLRSLLLQWRGERG